MDGNCLVRTLSRAVVGLSVVGVELCDWAVYQAAATWQNHVTLFKYRDGKLFCCFCENSEIFLKRPAH